MKFMNTIMCTPTNTSTGMKVIRIPTPIHTAMKEATIIITTLMNQSTGTTTMTITAGGS